MPFSNGIRSSLMNGFCSAEFRRRYATRPRSCRETRAEARAYGQLPLARHCGGRWFGGAVVLWCCSACADGGN